MAEVIETPAPEVILQPSPPAPDAPKRFEIPSFTEKKVETPAPAEPVPEAPKADLPPATEVKPPEAPKTLDPEAERRKEKLRVNRLYKQVAEEKALREAAERERDALKPKPQVPTGEPRMEDFTDVKEYANAVADWKVQGAIKEREAQAQAQAAESQQREIVERWESQVEAGAAKYEDFEQVVGDLKPTTPWGIAIMHASNGADIAYYLANNQKEAKRIIALPPLAQIYEIATIGAKFLATPPQPKKASSAPAPIHPVSGVAQPTTTIEPGMDFEKFRKLRNKQLGRS